MCAKEVLATKVVDLIAEHAIDENGDLNREHAISLVHAAIGSLESWPEETMEEGLLSAQYVGLK